MIFQDNVIKEYLKNVYFITEHLVEERQPFHVRCRKSMDLNYLMLMRDSTSTKKCRTHYFSLR